MENAADALKMAFAIFVFIVALSVVFSLLSRIKETADNVLWYADKTNYYENAESDMKKGRPVAIDTVISALYKQEGGSRIRIIASDGSLLAEFDPSDNKQINGTETKEDFIKKVLLDPNIADSRFLENVSEVTTSGQYLIAGDGTRIFIPGGRSTTRVYITYTQQ